MFLHSSQITQPCFYPLYSFFFMWVSLGARCSSILSSWYFCLTSCSLGWESLELEGAEPWTSTSTLRPLFPPGPHKTFLKFLGHELAFHLPHCPKNPKCCHYMVITANAVFDLPIPDEYILVSVYEEQQTTSPCVTQKRLSWMYSWFTCVGCVVPPLDTGVFKVPRAGTADMKLFLSV